jgi:large conductance mechanosensitive channel
MKLIKEFKEFAMKGNVVDLAVAVIIGGAFGKIISSLVADVLMPPIGLLLGGINFTDIKIKLNEAVAINIGNFIQASIDFIIIAFVIFIIIKIMNQAKKKAEATAPEAPSPEVNLLTEIRDALKK